MDNVELGTRLSALSADKQRLLALRLGLNAATEPPTGSNLVAFAITSSNTDTGMLKRHLQDQLPQYMVPSRVVVVDELPRTPNGKLDRAALQTAALARQPAQLAPETLETKLGDIERRLLAIWVDLLHIQRISIHDSFFDLGGHSLLAVRMLAQVKAAFDRDVPVSLIVEAPTVAQLADYLRRAIPKAAPESITAIQPNGSQSPLYLLPVHMHGALPYRHLKTYGDQDRPLLGFKGFVIPEKDDALPTVEALAAGYVEDLLAYQADGPYYLCGISVAGLIAFEMARQLRQRGVTKVEVILLDTYGPDYPQRLSAAAAILQHLGHVLTSLSPRQGLTQLTDRAWSWFEEWYSAWKTRHASRPRSHSAAPEAEGGFKEPDFNSDVVNRKLALMTRTYLAQQHQYDGEIHLYRARLQPLNALHEESLGWHKYVGERIHVEHLRGHHLGILRRRHVKQTAERVRRTLGQFDIKYQVTSF